MDATPTTTAGLVAAPACPPAEGTVATPDTGRTMTVEPVDRSGAGTEPVAATEDGVTTTLVSAWIAGAGTEADALVVVGVALEPVDSDGTPTSTDAGTVDGVTVASVNAAAEETEAVAWTVAG